MSEKYIPAQAIYLVQNGGSASKTYMDAVGGGAAVGGWQKVESVDFRNQYWYIVSANEQARPNVYYIVNIRNNTYLSLSAAASSTSFAISAKAQATTASTKKLQEWYFWKDEDGYCRIQNAAGRSYDEEYGYLYLKTNSATNGVEILTGKTSEDMTQRWKLSSRSRTADEIKALTKKTTLLKNAGNLLPGGVYLQMPNGMFKIIYDQYFGSASTQLIKPEDDARFDKAQIFAFKYAVNRWANDNLQCGDFFVLCGLAFGEGDDTGTLRTTSWFLDESLKKPVYFKSVDRKVVDTEPKFTPTFAFF